MNTVFISKDDNPRKMLDEAIVSCGGLSAILGDDKSNRVLIKGNFGCHKPSITGATTDLRIVSSLIETLQREGYSNIVVGDGGMAGYLKVNLLSYLGVTSLCEKYGVQAVDLNIGEGVSVKLPSGATVKISKIALESKVIDVAKLKTHVLATVTLGIKNMMGCVVGNDKRELHLYGLDENLANLPFIIKPCFTIIEGLTGMDGRGPVAGKPIKSNLLIASCDVIAADMVACKVIGFDPFTIKHVSHAISISPDSHKWADIKMVGTPVDQAFTPFEKAIPVGIEANPYMNKLKHQVRGTPIQKLIVTLMSAKVVANTINRLGILQEKLDHDVPLYAPRVEKSLCNGCNLCKGLCPASAISTVEKKSYIDPQKCVKCFCCVETCPRGAIKQSSEQVTVL